MGERGNKRHKWEGEKEGWGDLIAFFVSLCHPQIKMQLFYLHSSGSPRERERERDRS